MWFWNKEIEIDEPILSRQYLVAYTWYTEISRDTGVDSVIITLEPTERLTADKVKSLQVDILELISTDGHVNDPDKLIITAITELEI